MVDQDVALADHAEEIELLARLGADVVKVENPSGGDLGRGSQPAMVDPEGRSVGATFLRNNLGKRSVCIDLKAPAGRDLVLRLAPRYFQFLTAI